MALKQRIVVLTGAGISAESGLKTFRDGDGLWENHHVEDVATPEAWRKDPELVLRFYNMRRADCLAAKPNAAHKGLVELESKYEVVIVTQNIDDLHERAGSSNVVHLHGEILKMRSEKDENQIYPSSLEIKPGDKAPDGGQFRPHVVWFGEAVPNIEPAFQLVNEWADLIVLIGSSLLVYVIDPKIPDVGSLQNLHVIEKSATLGIKDLLDILL